MYYTNKTRAVINKLTEPYVTMLYYEEVYDLRHYLFPFYKWPTHE